MSSYVLVHGAWHGGWCWDDVADGLRARGHDVVAIDLPEHDRPGTTTRIWATLGHYVEAVAGAVAAAPEPPVLVGHSMGGHVVQRFLESGSAARGVLVASVPHRSLRVCGGALAANLRLMRRHPAEVLRASATLDYSSFVADDDLVRELFFTDDTPAAIVEGCRARLQNESARAILGLVSFARRPEKVTTPVEVIAGAHDAIFTLDEQRALAAAHGTTPTVIDGGHDLMLDTCWPELVDVLDRSAAAVDAA